MQIKKSSEGIHVITGYGATFNNVDRGNDTILPGAFKKTIERHKQENRPVRMYFQHDSKEIIGGFDAHSLREDAKGLHVTGQLNLGVQRGIEVTNLIKQGVLSDFSIGYSIVDFDFKDGVRILKELDLWEISVVSEPMNTEARILSKSIGKEYNKVAIRELNAYESLYEKEVQKKQINEAKALLNYLLRKD